MLSSRLWQTIEDPITHNPIFMRIRDDYILRAKPKTEVKIPGYVYAIIILLLIILFIRAPFFFIMVAQLPVFVILPLVLSPLAMPIFVVVAGSYLVSRIIQIIHKEKRQYTYELLCAAPDGCLDTSWLVATGILHRGSWFMWLKMCAWLCYRLMLVALIILGGFVVVTLPSMENNANRLEAVQTLINLILLAGLYYTSMIQPIVFSLVIGLHATSWNLNQRDTSLIGLFTYLIFQIVPFVIAFGLSMILTAIPDVPIPLLIGFDIIILGSIYVIRELSLHLMWWQLKRQFNSLSDYTILSSQAASATS